MAGTKPATTIDSTGAVKAAYAYLIKVSPTAASFNNVRLEEILIDDEKNYIVTLSYEEPGEFGFDKKKIYKEFKVEKDANVAWMKIRKI